VGVAIQPGTRLGPYEVLAAIGVGGMGEVYKARDTRLNRVVAIKVLPAHLADKPELRERFEREARTIASLNHPHICTLYDVGHQDGTDFLVMEYLEGETLATRLLKGPLPLEQTLQYAIEIVGALDKAHRKGVTHRDIKPGNVMLTKSGTKLLDFGLAKLKQATTPEALPESQMATLSRNPTVEGTLLGTIQYMAPEQVEGKNDEIDGRTDIFAFGALVYEMATGKKAFEGKTTASVIGKIMQVDPPPISLLQPMSPAQFDRVVKTCLEKEPDARWQGAADLRRELKWIAESEMHGGLATSAIRPDRNSASKTRVGWPVGVIAGIAAITMSIVAILHLREAPPAKNVMRTVITLPPTDQLVLTLPAIALSPDGTKLAYVATREGTTQIYLRVLDSLESKPLAGTNGASIPFFSPDGESLGFFAGGKLQKASLQGGSTMSLTSSVSPNPLGAAWAANGTIAFAPALTSTIQQTLDSGGAAQPLTRLEKDETSNAWPEFLPGGKALVFAAIWGNQQKVVLQHLATGQRQDLIALASAPRYAASGHLLYLRDSNLMAVPFDLQKMQITGKPAVVLEGVSSNSAISSAQYSISQSGLLAYVAGGHASGQEVQVWVDRDGTEEVSPAPVRGYGYPRISPDGRHVTAGIDNDVWVYDTARDTLTRLTFQGGARGLLGNPIWNPDGKRIVYRSMNGQGSKIFSLPADGSSGSEELVSGRRLDVNSFSADGQLMAYTDTGANTGLDIFVLHVADRKSEPFLQTPANEAAPSLSPDGHWLVYVSDESGRNEIYIQPYPGPGGKSQISTEGGNEPVWNPNGRELFYRSGTALMSVDISTRPTLSVGKPKKLFAGSYDRTNVAHPYYDVSPDGKRFLMIRPSGQGLSTLTQIILVQNFFEELKRLAPPGTK
jgi:serine/threonine protein kinase